MNTVNEADITSSPVASAIDPNLSVPSDTVWNVPNTLSMVRLVLAIGVGFLIELDLYLVALVTFVAAASTDFLDGWWARKFNQITKFGRILDPFVDKVIITAAFVALVGESGSQVAAWMVTVIICREMLVTSIRAMVEGKGGDFSARWLGKWKMVFQCAGVVASLLTLEYVSIQWISLATIAIMYLAVAITLVSGADYVLQAIRLNTAVRLESDGAEQGI